MISLDSYLRTIIRTQVKIDAASRVFLNGKAMVVHTVAGVRKVQLPNTQFLISLEDLALNGASILGSRTPRNLALYGAEARWAEQRKHREEVGLPINVYVANARSIRYAINHDRPPPVTRYIGRRQDKMTEVYDTIEEVVQAMNESRWRESFRRGRLSRRSK